MSRDIDSDVPMPTERPKRGPKPKVRPTLMAKEPIKRGPKLKFEKLSWRATADIQTGVYKSTLDAAKAYLFEYYPDCKLEQRNDKIRDIRVRLDLIQRKLKSLPPS